MTIKVSRSEVISFKSRWPCNNLPDHSITFHFEANGDIVDITGIDSSRHDGEALLALSNDAQNGRIGKQVSA